VTIGDVGMECVAQYPPLSSTSVQRLAEAVSLDPQRPVLLIGADNRGAGFSPLAEAVASGSAFAVKVAEHLLAIDADEVGPDYFRLTETLAEAGVETVEVASGGEGRRHLYVSLSPDVTADLRSHLTSTIRALGLDVRHTIRPPLSPHRRAGTATLLTPADPHEAAARLDRRATTGTQVERIIDRLRRPAATVVSAPAVIATLLAPLPESILTLLREGDTAHRYPSTSEAVWAVLLAAANRRWPVGRVIDALSGSPLWSQSSGIARDGEQYVEADYARAVQYVAEHPRSSSGTEVGMLLLRMQASAAVYRFPSGCGSRHETLAAVVSAVLDVAIKAGTVEGLHLSTYALADLATMSQQTAARALATLRRQGVIERTQTARGEMAATYRLNLDHDCFLLDVEVDEYRPVDIAQDAFRARGAVGKSGWRLLTIIASRRTATSEDALMQAYGIRSRKAFRRLLRRLDDAGLIYLTDEGWSAVSSSRRTEVLTDLAQLCDHRHTLGDTGETVTMTVADCQRLRRQQQRKDWEGWLRRRGLTAAQQHYRSIREGTGLQPPAARERELVPTG
jgi:hypothetical protein